MLFKSTEILRIAVQIEKNGESFYNAVKEKVHDPKAKELLEYLAKEESQHIVDFENIFKNVSINESAESYTGEFEDYMNILLEDNIFVKNTIDSVVANIKNHIDAIDTAIRFEKDSLLFFNELKKIVSNIDTKNLDALISEEHRHIVRLSKVKKEIE